MRNAPSASRLISLFPEERTISAFWQTFPPSAVQTALDFRDTRSGY